jgi:nucleotide-binding universal stress UspA family protein
MTPFPPRTILAALDGGEASYRATALAALIAGQTGATLDVLHVTAFDAPAYFTSEQVERLEVENRLALRAVRERVVTDLRGRGIAVDRVLVVDAAVADEVILEHAPRYDLVSMGTHGRRGARRWWLGSVAERVALGSPVPVLVVRGDSASDASVFSRIEVAGADGGGDASAPAYARALAQAFGGVIHETAALATCSPEALAAASLVVVGRAGAPHDGSALATTTLRECGRPLLIVPGTPGETGHLHD